MHYNEKAKHMRRPAHHLNRRQMVAMLVAVMICVSLLVGIPLSSQAEDVPTAPPAGAEPLDAATGTDGGTEAAGAGLQVQNPAPAPDAPAPDAAAAAAAPASTEDEEVWRTVTFKVNGSTYHEEKVLDGTLVPMPADPTGSARFLSWYIEGATTPFSPSMPIAVDTTLVAVFSEQHIVRFMDTDGSELEVQVVDDGSAAYEPAVQPTLAMGETLLYWSTSGDGGEYKFDSPVTEGLTLYPVTSSRSMAVFVTNGPEIEPQTDSKGFYAEEPDAALMVREGYTFSHWSATENGTEKFDFAGTPIDGTTFIYAVWDAEPVGYIVNYWNEKANIADPGDPANAANRGNYELVYTTSVGSANGAPAGEAPVITADMANSGYASGGVNVTGLLDYSKFAWADTKELSPFGNTVINVYYQRIEYTFTFDLTKKHGGQAIDSWIKLRGSDEKITGSYTIENIKLGQDISQLWPVEVGRDGTTEKPIAWNALYGNGTKNLTVWYLQQAMNGGKAGRHTATSATLRMNWQAAAYTEVRYYYTELPAGREPGPDAVAFTAKAGSDKTERYYELTTQGQLNYQRSDPWTSATGWPGTAIPGFQTIGIDLTKAYQQVTLIDTVNGVKNYRIDYYMPRLSYDLTLVTNGGQITESNGFGPSNGNYVKKVQYEAGLTLTGDPVKEGANFSGWYLDDQFQTKFDPNMTMPGRNLTLYARYTGTEVEVNYYDGGATPVKTNTYAKGETLKSHDLGGTEYANYNVGDTVPGKGIFRGWYYEVGMSGITVDAPIGMKLTRAEYNLYADFDAQNYKVTFVSNDDEGAEYEFSTPAVRSGNRNTLALQGHYESEFRPAREGYRFTGWNTQPDGGGKRFTTATRVLEDTTVYAQWAAITYTVDFETNGGNAVDPYTGVKTGSLVNEPAQPEKDGYAFDGWYTDNDFAQAWDFTADRVESNITLYAKWRALHGTPVAPVDPDDPSDPDEPADPDEGTVTPADEDGEKHDPSPAPAGTTEDPGAPPAGPGSEPDGAGGTTNETVSPQADSEGTAAEAATAAEQPVTAEAEARAETPVAGTQQDMTPSQAEALEDGEVPGTTLQDNDVPLFGAEGADVWALLNLISCIGGAALAIFAGIMALVRRRKDEAAADSRSRQKKVRPVWLVLTIILAVAGIIAFALTENMSNTMVWMDGWTPLMLVILAAGALCSIFTSHKKKEQKEEGTPGYVET